MAADTALLLRRLPEWRLLLTAASSLSRLWWCSWVWSWDFLLWLVAFLTAPTIPCSWFSPTAFDLQEEKARFGMWTETPSCRNTVRMANSSSVRWGFIGRTKFLHWAQVLLYNSAVADFWSTSACQSVRLAVKSQIRYESRSPSRAVGLLAWKASSSCKCLK